MRRMRVLAAIMALAAASGATAQEGRAVSDPDWLAKPSAQELAGAYPELAQMLNLEGRAVLACGVNDLGVLQDCQVRSEIPSGMGFGQAALALTERFRMKPRTVGGEPVGGGSVRIPIRFALPGRPTLAAPPTPPDAPEARTALARKIWERSNGEAAFVQAIEERVEEIDDYPLDPEALKLAREALREAAKRSARDAGAYNIASLAARYDEAQLRALADFAATPAGRVWLGLDPRRSLPWAEVMATYVELVAQEARGRFCATRICQVDRLSLNPVRQTAQIVDPAWLQAPGLEQALARMPEGLRLLRLGGVVRLACTVGPFGVPEGCEVAAETPRGFGLGPAALALAPYFKLNAAMMGQGAAGESLSFLVVFPGANFPGVDITPAAADPAENPELALELARLHMGEAPDATETPAPPVPAGADADVGARYAFVTALYARRSALYEIVAGALSRTFSREEMEDVRRFLTSPAGRQIAEQPRDDDGHSGRHFAARIGVAAGEAFCRKRECLGAEAPAAAPTP